MTSVREFHTATLLPSGKVLIAGGFTGAGYTNTADLFDPTIGTFVATSNTMTSAREFHTATLLPSGRVLIAGGFTGAGYTNTADLYDPASGTIGATSNMTLLRDGHTATLLQSSKVLITGGFNGSPTNTAELFDSGLGFSDARRPVLSTANNLLVTPASLSLTGTGFRGDSEASGGSFNNSATNYPILQLMRIDNEQTFFPLSNSATNWSDTAFSSETLGAVTPLPSGYYRVTIFTNAIPSLEKIISIGQVSVVSRMTHGSAGTFDINFPLTGMRGIECRSSASLGAGNYQMIFSFSNTLTSVGSASITAHNPASGTGTVSGFSSMGPNPNQYTVDLTSVSNAQYITVTLSNVLDAAGNSSNVTGPQMGVLLGDVDASGRVDSTDVFQVRQQTLQNANSSNFRADVDATGRIDSTDVFITRQQTLTSLPPTGVSNQQYITVTLNNVHDAAGNSSNVIGPQMGVLIGDTTGNGAVNSSDIAQTQSQSGQPVTSSNFCEDVTVNGSINSSDIAFVQSKSGTALPVGTTQSEDPTATAPKHRGAPGKSF
jgi:hypothetical protein